MKRGGGRIVTRTPSDGQQSSYIDLLELISSDGRTPSQSVANQEAIQAMQIAVAGLPNEQREAIRLRYLEGKSLDETASAMRRTQNAIRGLLHRAKQALREMLGDSAKWYSKK
jgi:RNA polymerase sigma-70 factor (ECF subfamily)